MKRTPAKWRVETRGGHFTVHGHYHTAPSYVVLRGKTLDGNYIGHAGAIGVGRVKRFRKLERAQAAADALNGADQ